MSSASATSRAKSRCVSANGANATWSATRVPTTTRALRRVSTSALQFTFERRDQRAHERGREVVRILVDDHAVAACGARRGGTDVRVEVDECHVREIARRLTLDALHARIERLVLRERAIDRIPAASP